MRQWFFLTLFLTLCSSPLFSIAPPLYKPDKKLHFSWEQTSHSARGSAAFAPASGIGTKFEHPSGTDTFPMVLLQFTDITGDSTAAELQKRLFAEDTFSIKTYYKKNSYGKYSINGKASGWYTMPYKETYFSTDAYNVDDGGIKDGTRLYSMVREALQMSDTDIDYSKFDFDNDGKVTVFIVVPGAGEEKTGQAHDFWSHESDLDSGYVTNDGVVVNKYLLFSEKSSLGVVVHEIGHIFGLIDLYDIDESSFGIGYWGLMSYGVWLGTPQGSNPAPFSAWSRLKLGWAECIMPETGGFDIDLKSNIYDSHILRFNSKYDSEYFLLEYRMDTDMQKMPVNKSGLLIWHIDDNQAALLGNSANAGEFHPCVKLVEADGNNSLAYSSYRAETTDMFISQRIGPSTTPALKSYYGSDRFNSGIYSMRAGTDSMNIRGVSNFSFPVLNGIKKEPQVLHPYSDSVVINMAVTTNTLFDTDPFSLSIDAAFYGGTETQFRDDGVYPDTTGNDSVFSVVTSLNLKNITNNYVSFHLVQADSYGLFNTKQYGYFSAPLVFDTVFISAPTENEYVKGDYDIRGTASYASLSKYSILLDGDTVFSSSENSAYNTVLTKLNTKNYVDGEHTLSLIAVSDNYETRVQRTIVIDNTPPTLNIQKEYSSVKINKISFPFSADEAGTLSIEVNSSIIKHQYYPAPFFDDVSVSLAPGQNRVTFSYDDIAGNSVTNEYTIQYAASGTAGLNKFAVYPNPARNYQIIYADFSAASSTAEIKIYNIAGELVKHFSLPSFTAGSNTTKWDMKNDYGKNAASGIYFVCLKSDFGETVIKSVKIK